MVNRNNDRHYGPLFNDVDQGPLFQQPDQDDPFAGAEIISCYTRAQALADGVLVDCGTLAKEAGIKYPVVCTRTVWSAYIEPDGIGDGQSVDGRLWDTLMLLRRGIKALSPGQNTVRFQVLYLIGGKRKLCALKAECGPGDSAEPVITIMLPEES